MENENIDYDYNYVMITANLLIENKNIDKIIKKEIDHDKIIQLIIKKNQKKKKKNYRTSTKIITTQISTLKIH